MLKLFVFLLFLSLIAADEITEMILNNPIIIRRQIAERCDEFPHLQFVKSMRGCRFYFYCDGENTYEGVCPIVRGVQLHFMEETQSCHYPEIAQCDIDDLWRGLRCPEFGYAKVPHPYQCDKYTVCFDGNQQDRDCPAGTHFSSFDQDCVDPEFANCSIEDEICTEYPFYLQHFFRSSRSCSEYFLCYLHRLSHHHCPDGQIFDEVNRYCVPDDGPACVPSNPTDDDFPLIPEQSELDCSYYRNEARIPHPETTHWWFFCHHNESSLIPCYRDQIFDDASGTCKPYE